MNVRTGVAGTVCALALTAGLGAFAGTGAAWADGLSYSPTTLGNDSYDNQVDPRNDIGVQGEEYTGPIHDQNADTVAEARSQSITIGTASDDASPVLLTNATGKNIKELSVRSTTESAYPSNMLSASLSNGASACWYVTYDDYGTLSYTNNNGDTYAVPARYSFEATFDDGTTAEFHEVNANGLRTLTLKYSDDYGVYYVERTTITNHTPDPSLPYEVDRAAYGNDAEYNAYANSAASTDRRAITASRGDAWILDRPDITTEMSVYAITLPLYGEPSGDYTNGVYEPLYWNSDSLEWRAFDFEHGFSL